MLCIICLDAARFELARTDLVIEQRGSDQVFQIVVGLLFGLWVILVTEGSTTRDIVTALEYITQDAIDVATRQPMSPLQLRFALADHAMFADWLEKLRLMN
jgi:hypothetical protein